MIESFVSEESTNNENVFIIHTRKLNFHVPKLMVSVFKDHYKTFNLEIKPIKESSKDSDFFLQFSGIVLENNEKHLLVSVHGLIFERMYDSTEDLEPYNVDEHLLISFYEYK